MVISRAPLLSRGLGRTALRRTAPRFRSQGWKQIGRRSYASGHGEQQSSELPWIIGSLAVTVPAAGWLLQQGPTKSDHGHEEHESESKDEGEVKDQSEEGKDEEQPADESTDDDKEESKDDGEEDKSDDKAEDKSDDSEEQEKDGGEDKEEDKSEESSEEGKDGYPSPSPGSPGQINWKPGMGKGPGEGQKGERKPSEKKGEKDSQGSHSGAKHPYIDDPEKSKKGTGVTETAKIHGTVDSRPKTGKSD